MLMGLKLELNDLRAALQMEQRQRSFDVERIGQELSELHQRVTEGQAELARAGGDWQKALAAEAARLIGAVQEIDGRLGGEVARVNDAALAEAAKVRAEVARVSNSTAERDLERQRSIDTLDALIKANAEGDNEFSREVTSTQEMNKAKLKKLEEVMAEQEQYFLELGRRTAKLGGIIDSVQSQHSQEHQGLHALLLTEVQRMEQVIVDFRETTASAIRRHWKGMTDDFAEVRARIAGLNTGLESERQERHVGANMLHGKIEEHWAQTMKYTPLSPDRPEQALYTHRPQR